jgi:hypothetical protein
VSRPTYGKQDRERSKKAKAEAKRERRRTTALSKAAPDGNEAAAVPDESSTAAVLQMLDELHHQHANGEIADDDFESAKADLLNQLVVE